MKIAYFDCFSGISGNMILGALIDAGLDVNAFKNELNKINVGVNGRLPLSIKRVNKHRISSTYFEVNVRANSRLPQRNLKTIVTLINKSKLSSLVKSKSIEIFIRLAKAEAKVHRTSINNIHFHEVGALDAIIDVIGSVIALELMGIKEIYCSPLPLSHGFVKCDHGILPVPAPATLELIKGLPVYKTDVKGELVTPTGAAIISTLTKGFGMMPDIELIKTGYGAGKKDLRNPNVLRVIIGERTTDCGLRSAENVFLLETNIDDMNPQFYDHVMDRLFKAGALDVWLENIQMKKNRPGIKLSVLLNKKDLDEISRVILSETTTLGIRIREASRQTSARTFKSIKTKYGNIRIKISSFENLASKASPEYDDCRLLALKNKVPLKNIYKEVSRVLDN